MCAAVNPFRVKDLLHKYGWDALTRVTALGIQHLAEAQILFVDSGSDNALDADDEVHGHSFEHPLATWDYAIGLCTAGERSVILMAPGHNENLGDAQITHDVADVVTIGIGDGPNKPRIDFDHANSSIDVSANNVVIKNVNFLPSTGSVLIGVHVMTGALGFKMVDCDFMIGEDGSGADEFVKAVELTSGNHDTTFENVTILAHASAAQATHGIDVAAASDRLIFRNVIIDGPYATGGIVEAAAGKNHIVEYCSVDVTGTDYSFHASSTFAKKIDNVSSSYLLDLQKQTINHPLFTPSSMTKVWYVDERNPNSGTSAGYGLSWEKPFSTIAAAIAANNASIDWGPAQGEWWGLNNYIFIGPSSYAENLTSAPHSCTVIGLGSSPNGYPTTEGSVNINPSSGTPLAVSTHVAVTWYNIQFESIESAGKDVDLGICNNSAFIKCRFHTNIADLGVGLECDDAAGLVVRDCIFSSGTTDIGTAISIGANSGTSFFGCVIENNIINAATAGIAISSTVTLSGGSWIRNNDIANPAKGVDLNNTSNNLIRVSGNNIIASSDCIEGATAALCIANWTNENGTADWEPDEAD